MNKKIILGIFLLSQICMAQSAGNTGLAFLKFGSGARNISMSDLGVVGSKELTAYYYNPSLISINNKTQLSFTHNNLFADLSSEMFSGSFFAFGIPLAININTTSIKNIEIRTQPGEIQSRIDANYFSVGFSSAVELFNNFHAGLTIKYIYENLYTDEATGFGFDIGAVYSGLVNGISVGLSIRNLGSMSKLKSESAPLPKDFRAGISYSLFLGDSKFKMNTVTGIQKYFDTDDLHIHLGTEIEYDDSFFLRGGFVTGYESKNFSVGFGLHWKGLNLDYAYVPIKYGLGDSHIITFIFTF